MFLFMRFQMALNGETAITLRTLKRIFARVKTYMNLQIIKSYKLFATMWTILGLATMHLHVQIQVGFAQKRLFTLRTGIGETIRVHDHVCLQIFLVIEQTATFGAPKIAFTCAFMTMQMMFFQADSRIEAAGCKI